MNLSGSSCLRLFTAVSLSFLFARAAQPASAQIVTIDVPGAVYTVPVVINRAGVVSGWCGFSSGNHPTQAFLRTPDGRFITFFAPHASVMQTNGMNDAGDIVGQYQVETPAGTHAFIRAANGVITTFDGPGATVTQAFAINSSGTVVGSYTDIANNIHGFVRDASGTLTTFDGPGSTFTGAISINSSGVSAGYYEDNLGHFHGLVRDASGVLTTFDVAEATKHRTFAYSINDFGVIAGSYETTGTGVVDHGFIRDVNGDITTFDGVDTPNGTVPRRITNDGVIVGSALAAHNVWVGFERFPNGTIRMFAAPGAGKDSNQGTLGSGINEAGKITGTYVDRNGNTHGYLK